MLRTMNAFYYSVKRFYETLQQTFSDLKDCCATSLLSKTAVFLGPSSCTANSANAFTET